MNTQYFFCQDCNELTDQNVCPKCGKQTREVHADDLCFVRELSGMDADMYADALENNDVQFVKVPSFSINAIDAPKLHGVNWEGKPAGYKFYARYADHAQATEVLDVLFGGEDNEQPLSDHELIDRIVKVTIDRPYGSRHPEHPDIRYEVDYGHVEGVMGGDGEEQDAYVLGLPKGFAYVGQELDGFIVAVIRRKNDVETKWVVSFSSRKYTREEIAKAVHFQEQFFDIEIIM